MTSASVTAEFRDDFERERGRWLRRRVLIYCAVSVAIQLLFVVLRVGNIIGGEDPATLRADWFSLAFSVMSIGVYAWAFVHTRSRMLQRDAVIRLIFWIFVGPNLLLTVLVPFASHWINSVGGNLPLAGAVTTLNNVFVFHLFASLFIPWTPRECVRALSSVLVAFIPITLLSTFFINDASFNGGLLVSALSPLVGLPGVAICWWRHGAFRKKFIYNTLKGRYGELRRELSDARQIHESLFPSPIDDGPVRMTYEYEPMRQIGGDFLHAQTTVVPGKERPLVHVVVIDVTGHGITAALTVNRLHGEILRELAEDPGLAPGDLLRGLNSYVHNTLAIHSVYATAIVLCVDPNDDTLRWASAGHPPAMLRTVDGAITQLDSTAIVLGACRGDDYEVEEGDSRFRPGDMLLAYTDGATEARNHAGKMLMIDGLLKLLATVRPDAEGGWAGAVRREVERYRDGKPADDDTLLVEVYRPLELASVGEGEG
ncbi:MAG: PP2C family protein-serine/threonine phosphatase [Planctomycetota bacterium]